MSDDVTGILDECLDRLQAGESEAECMARYPAHAAELSLMLGAAARVSAGLRPARLSSAQRLQAKSALRQAAAVRNKSRYAWLPGRLMPARLGLGRAAIVAAFVLLAGAGTAVAASQPGELAYGVRVMAERVPALIQPDPHARADAELGLAERRLADVRSELARDGRVDSRALAALLLADETAAQKAAGLAPEARAAIAAAVAEHARVLEGLSRTAPASTQAALAQTATRAETVGREAAPEGPAAEGAGTPDAAVSPTPVTSLQNSTPEPEANSTKVPPTVAAGNPAEASSTARPTNTVTPTDAGRAPDLPPGQTSLTKPAPRRGNPPPGRGKDEDPTAQGTGGTVARPRAVPGPAGQTPKPDRTPPGLAGQETPKPAHPTRENPGGPKHKSVPPGKQSPTPSPHP